MVRPAGQRSLAGFTVGDLLARQVYGDLYRASGEGRREVRLLVVDAPLAADPRFGDALAAGSASLLGAFHHRAVVGTVVVAKDGKDLVIVTEAVRGARTLDDILDGAGGRGLPPRVAAAIARSVIDGVATAHAVGITHGALHPRSILIDDDGAVRVTDFAVGHAAMAAAAAGSEAMSLRGFGGYLAPEVALGDVPGPVADVYAMGALLFTLLSGATPPGTINTTPAVERLVQRALDTDLHRRFANAIELQENFSEALEDDRWDVATPAEVHRALADLGPAPAPDGDDGIEDLLASLPGTVEVTRPTATGAPAAPPTPPPEATLDAPIARRASRGGGGLDALLDDLDESADDALTHVDDGPGQAARDPISELIAMTPAPAPELDPPARARRAPVLAAPEPTGETLAAAPDPSGETVAPAPVPEPAPAPPKPRRVATPMTEVVPELAPPRLTSPWKSWVIGGISVAVLAGGGYVLVTGMNRQGKEIEEGKAEAARKRAETEAANRELEQRLRDNKAKPGNITVRSTPDLATVWLLLGRAPFESIQLATTTIWELRVELEGYQPQDLHVVGSQWSGTDDALRASITVKLAPLAGDAKPLPAMPAAPTAREQPGPPKGKGRLSVTTDPPGAAVYLLVGQTNTMELAGVEAARDYEFKLTRDGSVPGFVRVAAEDWRNGGDPNVPLRGAPLHGSIERSVELVPAPTRPGKPR
ncbi:MAG: protein kinase [Myxococcales bacterium]|nr:protein kinase [Myxococcales bacterium]